jgi:D-erythrulose 4-kinase
MTRIFNTPEDFVDEALAGFAAVHSDIVARVDGGVVRAGGLPVGQVAVVVGGGSGHYPAFAGLVGPGFAAAAVCGNIFSSPSAAQAERVVREIEAGGGVLFLYGNYAGDVLHFGQAQETLRRDGLDVRTVLVTDDVASAPETERHRRRGVAGDLVVFKIAAAAAERGWTLDEVERVARHANERTRTLGVAFAGCTLPGAGAPLFVVPDGVMSVGLGIHGEPGISDQPIPSADELASIFVDRLLDELPEGVNGSGSRATVIVNGLGSIKYEELFVLYGSVARRLQDAGVVIVAPECGELVTSLDMAGVSVTICWLDDDLATLWNDPASAPAFRRGAMMPAAAVGTRRPSRPRAPISEAHLGSDSPESIAVAPVIVDTLRRVRDAIEAQKDELGRIDAIAGDGDHGIGMGRGLNAALDAAEVVVAEGRGAASALTAAGAAWADRAGGTSGALWGAALAAAAQNLRAHSMDGASLARAAIAAIDEIVRVGQAKRGDKTMVDAALPFAETLRAEVASGSDHAAAWRAAAVTATDAAAATSTLSPRLGRARPLAEKSVGHPDAGAVSFALIARTIAESLEETP